MSTVNTTVKVGSHFILDDYDDDEEEEDEQGDKNKEKHIIK